MSVPLLEIVVSSIDDAIEAERGGATRLELVRDLHRGGLTPAAATVRAVIAAVRIPVRVMVRETDAYGVSGVEERDRLCAAARECCAAGVDGLVLGFVRGGRGPSVDLVTTMDVLAAAPGTRATFHHAFDACADAAAAFAHLRACRRIDAVLTHGVGRDVDDRHAHLAALGRAAAGITVMVGGGVDAGVIRRLRWCDSVGAFHVGRAAREPPCADGRVTAARVRALVDALYSAAGRVR